MSKDNLALRKQQLEAVQMSEQMAFTFKAVKAAPKNYISEADMVLADVAILEAGQSAVEEYYDLALNGGIYKDKYQLSQNQMPENKKALRNNLAQQLKHEQMVDMQYNK